MISAAADSSSLSWESHTPSHQKFHDDNHDAIDGQDHRQFERTAQLKIGPDGKKKPREIQRRKRATSVKSLKEVEEHDNVMSKVCADCKTSKTPLWRSGPDGPKSLCNACGIRRKRKKRGLGLLKMGRNIVMEDENMKKVLFLLQRKFAGEEEAEAAVHLMALSCGLPLHT